MNADSYNSARIAAGTAARVATAVVRKEVLNGAAIGRQCFLLVVSGNRAFLKLNET